MLHHMCELMREEHEAFGRVGPILPLTEKDIRSGGEGAGVQGGGGVIRESTLVNPDVLE
jgi:hypothetical protein